jgi:hypothetical protein
MIELIFIGVVALLGGVFLIHTRLNDMEKKQDKHIAISIADKKNLDRKIYDMMDDLAEKMGDNKSSDE